MKHFLFILIVFSVFSGFTTSCIPPRCKIPNCHVAIDHNHPKYGQKVKGGQSPYKVYRGVPWYNYVFRKKYKAQSADGKYRKIDNREAWDKR